MTPVRFELAASRSRVKHSTTEPLRSQLFSEIRPLIDGTLSKINSLEFTDGPCLTDMKSKLKQEGQVALKRSPEFCLKLTYRYL